MPVPILYVGAPGIGKTAYVRTQYDYVEVLLLSSMTEEDISGLPYREGDQERRTIPRFVERLRNRPKAESICLFLDEIDKARREVVDTLLTLITHPEEFGLPNRIVIRAAANPPEWGGGDGLSQAMLSRFAVIEFEADIEGWQTYMNGKYDKHPVLRYIVDGVLSERVPFLEANGEGFNFRLSTPRTWEMAVQCIITGEIKSIDGLLTPNCASFLKGFVESVDPDQKISRGVGSQPLRNNILRI